ncbi:unnamed protein product, partial [Oikopleura dioica]
MADATKDDASKSWLNDKLLQTLKKIDNEIYILLVGLILLVLLVIMLAICIKIYCCTSKRKFPSSSGTKCVRHQQSMTSPLDSPMRGIMTRQPELLSTQVAKQSNFQVQNLPNTLPLANQIPSTQNQQNPYSKTPPQNDQIRRQRAPSLQSLPDTHHSYRDYQPSERLLKRNAQTLPTPTNRAGRRSSRPGTAGNLGGDCSTVGSNVGSRDHIVGRLSECPESMPLLVKSRALVHHQADESIDESIDPARSGVPNGGTTIPQSLGSKGPPTLQMLPSTTSATNTNNLTPDHLKPEVAFS